MSSLTSKGLSTSLQGEFIVPNYYPKFSCKGGSCRNTCCAGWGVKISQKQYYQLLSIDTSVEIKENVDRAFRVCLNPTVDTFAEIAHTFQGVCPLLTENGWCQLHQTLGETYLPTICRYYPKAPKNDYVMESSCSNSCERTLELLTESSEPITFEVKPLAFDLPMRDSQKSIDDRSRYSYYRTQCFAYLSDRSVNLSDRIRKWGSWFSEQKKDALLLESRDGTSLEIGQLLRRFYPVFHHLLSSHHTLTSWVENERVFFEEGKAVDAYQKATLVLSERFPNHEIYLEKILLNHLVYSGYPYSMPFDEAYAALVGLYAFIRLIVFMLIPLIFQITDYIDVMAKLFRVIGHSSFERNMIVLMNDEGLNSLSLLNQLVSL